MGNYFDSVQTAFITAGTIINVLISAHVSAYHYARVLYRSLCRITVLFLTVLVPILLWNVLPSALSWSYVLSSSSRGARHFGVNLKSTPIVFMSLWTVSASSVQIFLVIRLSSLRITWPYQRNWFSLRFSCIGIILTSFE